MWGLRVLFTFFFSAATLAGISQDDTKYNEDIREVFRANKVKARKITRISQDGTAPFAMIEYLDKEGRPISTLLHNVAYDRITKVDSTVYKKDFLAKKIFFANDVSDSVIYDRNSYGVLQRELHYKAGKIIQERTFFYHGQKIQKEIIKYIPLDDIMPVSALNKKDSITYVYSGDTVTSTMEPSGQSVRYLINKNNDGYVESIFDFCEVRKEPCKKKFFEYDRSNRLLRKKEFSDTDMLFRYLYFYDREGLCVKEQIYTPGNDEPVATILFEYFY